MIHHTPYSPYEFRSETQAQDSEILSMFKASLKVLDNETILQALVITLLADFQDTKEEMPIETRCALREHLNRFTKTQQEMIKDYLKTY